MSSVEYTSSQQAQIDALSAQIEAYCEANGIDPSVYTAALDGETIDPAILNDPAFLAYWQRAYLELMEIINPSLVQSIYAETGEIDFDTLYAAVESADPSLNDFLENLVTDDPELMAYFASTDGNTETDANAVLDGLNAYIWQDTSNPYEYNSSGQANDYPEGSMYNFLYSYQDDYNEFMASSFEWSSDLSANTSEWAAQLESGEITPEEFEAFTSQNMLYEETVMNLRQNMQDAFTNMVQMFSNFIKMQSDLDMSIISKYSPA